MRAEIDLSFNQILELVRQLPKDEQLRLSSELEKEVMSTRLLRLLEEFQTTDLSFEDITKEVEIVRQELYDRKRKA